MVCKDAQDIFIYMKQLMIAKNISVNDLAATMYKSQSTVSGTMGKRNVKLSTIIEMCNALGYDFEFNLIPKEPSTEKAG